MAKRTSRRAPSKKRPWRRIGGVLVVVLPVLFFLPGIGFDASHPASLARRHGPDGTWYYPVRKDDVLTKIAERELGTFQRYKEILELNPGIEPRRLEVGSVLRMPPKVSDPARRAATKAPPAAGRGNSPRRLLAAFAALLGLVLLVVAVAGHLEKRTARG